MKFVVFLILALSFNIIACQQPEGYSQVELEDFYTDNLLQTLVDFGSQHVIDSGIETGDLPDTEYYITQIYNIYKSDLVDDKESYAFDVMIVDHDGSAIRANFIVRHSPSTDTNEVISSAYDGTYYYDDFFADDFGEELLAEISGDVSSDVSASELEFLGDIWFTEDNIIDPKGNFVLGTPISVSLSQFTTDPDIQNVFIFGLEDVLDQIVPEEMAVAQFHVTNIHKATKQIVNGLNYLFDTEVESTSGTKVRVNFEVYSQSWTGVVEVLSYSYQLTKPDGSVVTGEENFVGL